jgi:hypothetical protein
LSVKGALSEVDQQEGGWGKEREHGVMRTEACYTHTHTHTHTHRYHKTTHQTLKKQERREGGHRNDLLKFSVHI